MGGMGECEYVCYLSVLSFNAKRVSISMEEADYCTKALNNDYVKLRMPNVSALIPPSL